MRVPVALPFCLRAAVAFAPSTRREVAVRLHANDDARDDGPVQIQLDAVAGENASDDELDWDAEFANLQRSRQGSSDSAASALAPPPPPLPVPRIRGAGRRSAASGEAFSRRREIVDGRDVGPAPLRRDGPVNPDARQREEMLAESFSQTGLRVLSFTVAASALFFLAVGALGGITDGSDRFSLSEMERDDMTGSAALLERFRPAEPIGGERFEI